MKTEDTINCQQIIQQIIQQFDPPCLLPERAVEMWGKEHKIKPALVKEKFGSADYWICLAPIMHRPLHYIVAVDAEWMGEYGEGSDEFYDHLDDIYEAIEDEFGMKDPDSGDDLDWPEADFEGGSAWWEALPSSIVLNA